MAKSFNDLYQDFQRRRTAGNTGASPSAGVSPVQTEQGQKLQQLISGFQATAEERREKQRNQQQQALQQAIQQRQNLPDMQALTNNLVRSYNDTLSGNQWRNKDELDALQRMIDNARRQYTTAATFYNNYGAFLGTGGISPEYSDMLNEMQKGLTAARDDFGQYANADEWNRNVGYRRQYAGKSAEEIKAAIGQLTTEGYTRRELDRDKEKDLISQQAAERMRQRDAAQADYQTILEDQRLGMKVDPVVMEQLRVKAEKASADFDDFMRNPYIDEQKNQGQIDWLQNYISSGTADYDEKSARYGVDLYQFTPYEVVQWADDANRTDEERKWAETFMTNEMRQNGQIGVAEYRDTAVSQEVYESLQGTLPAPAKAAYDKAVSTYRTGTSNSAAPGTATGIGGVGLDAAPGQVRGQGYASGKATEMDDAIREYAILAGISEEEAEDQVKRGAEYTRYIGAQQNRAELSAWATEHPFASSAFTVLTNPWVNMTANAEVIGGALSGNAARSYDEGVAAFQSNQGIRQTVGENLGGGTRQWLYNAVMSTADSAMNMLAMQGAFGAFGNGLAGNVASQLVSAAIMGSGASVDTYIQGKQEGMRDGQVFLQSILAGAIEGITEAIGGERVWKNIVSDKSVGKALLQSFLSEGTDEVASNVLNRLVANGIKQYNRAKYGEEQVYDVSGILSGIYGLLGGYRQMGYSDKDAFIRALCDVLEEDFSSFMAGGLSGLLMGGAGRAVSAAGTAVGDYVTGRQMISEGLRNAPNVRTINEGLRTTPGANAAPVTESSGAYQFGRAVRVSTQARTQTNAVQAVKDLTPALEQILASQSDRNVSQQTLADRKTISSAVAKQLVQSMIPSDMMTESMQRALEMSEAEEKIAGTKTAQSLLMQAQEQGVGDAIAAGIVAQLNRNQVQNDLLDKKSAAQIKEGQNTRGFMRDKQTVIAAAKRYGKDLQDIGIEAAKNDLERSSKARGEARTLTDEQVEAIYNDVAKEAAKGEVGSSGELVLPRSATTRAVKEVNTIFHSIDESDSNAREEFALAGLAVYNVGLGYGGTEYAADLLKEWQEKHPDIREQLQQAYDKGLAERQLRGETVTQSAVAATEEDRKQRRTSMIGEKEAKARGVNTVDFDRIRETLGAEASTRARQMVRMAQRLSRLLNVDIVFFDSYDSDLNWTRGAANGWYAGGKVYLDINSGLDNGGSVVFTLSHEITHLLARRATAEYQALENFVVDYYYKNQGGRQGYDRALAAIIDSDRDIARMSNDADKEAAAREELVARSCENMLTDSKAIRALYARDAKLAGKIASIVKKFTDAFDRAMKALVGDNRAHAGNNPYAETFAQSAEAMRQLQELWDAALMAAAERGDQVVRPMAEIQQDVEAGKAIAPAEEVVFSLKQNDAFMTAAEEYNASHGTRVSAEAMREARIVRQTIADIFNDPARELNLPPDNMGNTFLPDSSYGGTEENTTVCIRSLAAQALMDRIGEKLGRPLTVDETLILSQEIANYTDKPECFYCYVATDRRAYRQYLGDYIQQRDAALKDLQSGKPRKEAYADFLQGRKDTANMQKRFAMWANTPSDRLITAADLASVDKLTTRIAELSAIKNRTAEQQSELDQLKDAAAYAQSASWAKKMQGYTAYNGHILKWKDGKIRSLNAHYGLRMYSFSDFSAAFILENMQMVTDAAVRGLKMLAYTKEIAFARIMAETGMNINISVYASIVNGKVTLDGMQGADWDAAIDLRKQYPNIGLTLVATNDELVHWGLMNPNVDVVIPYHLVRTGKAVADYFGFNNYTNESADGKLKLASGEKRAANSVYPTVHHNDIVDYVEALGRLKLTPRFERFITGWREYLESDRTAKDKALLREQNPYYMKLVNETRRSADETPAVQPRFNLGAAKEAISVMEAKGGYGVAEVFGKSSIASIEAIEDDVLDAIRAKENAEPKFSVKEYRGQKYAWIEERVFDKKKPGQSDYAYIEEYIENLIAETGPYLGSLPESGMDVYTEIRGRTPQSKHGLSDEFVASDYTQGLSRGRKSKTKRRLKAKMWAAGGLRDIVSIAERATDLGKISGWSPAADDLTKDAPYGIYRYRSTFAFPVYNTDHGVGTWSARAFDCVLIILNGSDGHKYLYDIENVKENRPLANDLSRNLAAKQAAGAKQFSDSLKDTVPHTPHSVKTNDADYLAAVERGDMDTAQRMVDEAAKAAGYRRVGDYYIADDVRLTHTKPTKRQQYFYDLGASFADMYRKNGGDVRTVYEAMSGDDLEALSEQESGVWERFFLAGLRGDKPQYRLAYRFGEIPSTGRSTNWADGSAERGVSVVSFLDENTQNEKTLYDAVYAAQGADKIIVGGWDFGIFGSDGEPLMVYPEKVTDASEMSNVKLAKPIYDDNGKLIPLSERFNTEQQDIRYSQKDRSDREVLSDALMEAAQTEGERSQLREYQMWMKDLDAKQERLQLVNKKIKEISFGGGQRDSALLKTLTQEAAELKRTINRYDKKLLNLEAAEPLKAVLQRERDAAFKAAAERGRKRLQAYRIQRDQSAAVKKYRGRIESDVKDLLRLVTENSDKRHVPDQLRQPLADFLKSIDVQSVQASEGGPDTRRDQDWARRFERLTAALNAQRADELDGKAEANLYLPDDFYELMNKAADAVWVFTERYGGTELYGSDAETLRDLSKVLQILTHAVREANNTMVNNYAAKISELGEKTMEQLRPLGTGKTMNRAAGWLNNLIFWQNGTPYYVFKRFGAAGFSTFQSIMDGQGKLAAIAEKVIQDSRQMFTSEEVKDWQNEVHEVELSNDRTVRMTTAQLMSFYCLSKRQQAVGHLLGGGMKIDAFKDGRRTVDDRTDYVLGVEDIQTINGLLTDRQREVADAIQRYMSTYGSELGNEVSMRRFGYKAYGEANYFPIVSDRQNLDGTKEEEQRASLLRLLNMSHTKSLVDNANNALVVQNIFDVFSNHMSDMAEYNALALPVLDMVRWFNYKNRKNTSEGQIITDTVQKSLATAFGGVDTGGGNVRLLANEYVKTFLKDLNGNNERGRDIGIGNLMGKYKRASVAANLRVAIQQPMSIMRASAVLDPKWLAKGIADAAKAPRELSEELSRYSNEAKWKDQGHHDIYIGRSVAQQIKNDQSVWDRAVERSMVLAEIGDKVTWTALWAACKAEQQGKGLSGEALMDATARRFQEVIYATQVMDATTTRSQSMRSNSPMNQMWTAFMAEPTLSVNLLADSFVQWRLEARRGGDTAEAKKKAFRATWRVGARAIAAYAFNALAVTLAESLIDAIRDDDDYETFVDKYLSALGENWMEELNPLSKVTVLKEVLNIFTSKYGAGDRMDLAALTSAKKSIDIMVETYKVNVLGEDPTETTYYGKMTWYGKAYQLLKTVSQITGVPFAGLSREMQSVWNNMFYPGLKAAGVNDVQRLKTYAESAKNVGIPKLYDALVSGNESEAIKLRTEMYYNGVSDETVTKALKEQIKDHYISGDLEPEETERLLVEYCGYEVLGTGTDSLQYQLDKWAYDGDDNFKIGGAIEAAFDAGDIAAVKEAIQYNRTKYYQEDSAIKSTITSYWKKRYEAGASKATIKQMMTATGLYTAEDVEKKFAEWDKAIAKAAEEAAKKQKEEEKARRALLGA